MRRALQIIIFLLLYLTGIAQQYDRIAFYNVENFFDTEYDSTKNFNGFTPEGDHHWTRSRYYTKRTNIYKVIAALGQWQGVTVLGLAEIENKNVLKDLINNTPLKNMNYGIVHYDSPDKRGIDLGVIYLKDRFNLIKSNHFRLNDPQNPNFTTRDILYLKGVLQGDTVHLFYNHWPSRYGGMMNTVRLRKLAARRLLMLVDSVRNVSSEARVIILGDFNDNLEDESLQYLIRSSNGYLVPLPWVTDYGNTNGTIKHHADWAIFDRIIVSKSLLLPDGLHIDKGKMHIFDINFLLTNDEKNLGYRLNRTYVGFKYSGGFSDHLPVYVDVVK